MSLTALGFAPSIATLASMKSVLLNLFLCSMGTACLLAAEPEVLFHDTFDGRLGEGWTWLREMPQSWRLRDSALEIRFQPGDANTVRNALVRKAPDRREGKYVFEVTLDDRSAQTQQFEQSGITWYSNGKPVFKLVKELVDGQLMIIPGRKPMTNAVVRLQLVVDGDAWTARFRPGSTGEFQTADQGKLPPPGDDQVSLQCYHGPPNAEHWVRFDDFRILKLTK